MNNCERLTPDTAKRLAMAAAPRHIEESNMPLLRRLKPHGDFSNPTPRCNPGHLCIASFMITTNLLALQPRSELVAVESMGCAGSLRQERLLALERGVGNARRARRRCRAENKGARCLCRALEPISCSWLVDDPLGYKHVSGSRRRGFSRSAPASGPRSNTIWLLRLPRSLCGYSRVIELLTISQFGQVVRVIGEIVSLLNPIH